MASLPRADLSVSSELHSMARMRAHARELSAKDAVWQGQLLGAAASAVQNASATRPPTIPPVPAPISLPLSVSPIPTSPQLCASPVSPGEMTGSIPIGLGISTATRMINKNNGNGNVRGKIRRKRLTKEEEAKFKPAQLTDLTGTTAARSRKMSREEHELMLHKRRLRNRESAARSRDRQRRTTADLAVEVDALVERTRQLEAQCEKAAAAARHHAARADSLERANQSLLAQLTAATANAVATSNGDTANTGNSPGVPRPAIPRAVVTNVSAAVPMGMSMPMSSVPMPAAAPMSIPMSSPPAAGVPQSLPMSISGNIIGIPANSAGLNSSGNLALVPPLSAPQAVSAGMSSSSLPAAQRPPGASNPALSTDTIDRLLSDQPLPHMNASHSLLRIPSWPNGGGTFPNSL